MDVPILGEEKGTSDEPAIRLLYCRTCGTIEELPDFDGPPQYDHLLEISVDKHRFPSGDEHIGTLMKVSLGTWVNESARRQIIDEIKGTGLVAKGLGAVDESFYDTRSTFHEDAMACFRQHQRPKGQCPDFYSDKKVLRPNTKKDRKDLGLSDLSKVGGPRTYLCDFCPVKVYNITKAREQQGEYQ